MRVDVHYFAAARDLAGLPEESIELALGSTTAALLAALGTRHARLAPHLARMRLAVNGELTLGEVPLADGDEVALLPPVAGGDDRVALAALRDAPLSVDEALSAVRHDGAGGVALFVGVVRDVADGKPVARLDYEAHPTLALSTLREVLASVVAEHPGARVAVVHRVGSLRVGDLAVVVAASAPHRAEAFAACRAAIERLKESVPIWKKEWAPDGSATWVNLEG